MTKSPANSGENTKLRTHESGSEKSSELARYSTNQFDLVFERMIDAVGGKRAADLAGALGISQASVSGAKRRKNIPDSWYLIIADKFGVSSDWLRTGEGEMRRGMKFKPAALPNQDMDSTVGSGGFVDQLAGSPAGQERKAGSANNGSDFGLGDVENFDMGEVLAQTIDILNSKTVYTTAIVSNIKAFHKAITTEKKIEDMQEQLSQALASFSSFQAQLDKTNQTVSKLQSENEKLHQELVQSRAGSTFSDTG
ncbi:MAG: helix-turn-helix domain-containing protein [Desulfomicrobium sp.]